MSRWLVSLLLLSAACGGKEEAAVTRTITLAAYTTPREAYDQEIIPAFTKAWKEKTGEDVVFETSYLASGAQSRAVAGGFEADIVALALEADVERLTKEGLVTHDWRAMPNGGMVHSSVAVLCVREGNPKGIRGWDDLRRADVEVITPNVRTSGGAMWNVMAIWGAALRGHTAATPGDPSSAEAYLSEILARVSIMDKGARESMITYDQGMGDVAITYENEVIAARLAGKTYEYVIPESTIRIDNPIAVVDTYAVKHGNGEIAKAFVEFTYAADSQRSYAKHGFRPSDSAVGAEFASSFPPVQDLFTVHDLGGWDGVAKDIFDPDAAYDRALTKAQAGN